MRITLTVFGGLLVLAYAGYGAYLMNVGEVVAASGLPLEQTIIEMEHAGQPYTPIPGFLFAGFGVLLAAAWTTMTIAFRSRLSGWFALSILGAILAAGAVAYFYTSFANMNSVGDTFFEWDSEAAFALASRQYLVSGLGALVSVAACIVGAVQAARRHSASPTPTPGSASVGPIPAGGAAN